MCPLAPEALLSGSISSCWTDEQIISSLNKIIHGSAIPDDVIVDNPFQYDPSNLPDGAWFLTSSKDEKEAKHGMWKVKGVACEIFSNSKICGWRTTYEFQASTVQKTVWMMQEYKVTQKGHHNRDEIKLKDSALCRVFSCCDEKSNNEMKPDYKIEAQVNNQTEVSRPSFGDKFVDPSDDTIGAYLDSICGPSPGDRSVDPPDDTIGAYLDIILTPSLGDRFVNPSNDAIEAELDSIFRPSPGDTVVDPSNEALLAELDSTFRPSLGDKSTDPSGDNIVAELDCILNGEYLELDDLVDAASHSSSSENSSRQSVASDEWFDSLALLRDLDDEEKQDLDGKGSTSMMMGRITNDVVMHPAPLEAAAEEVAAVKGEPSPEHAVKRMKAECTNEGTSKSYRATACSSSSSSSSDSNEPVARLGERRMRKLKRYFCFLAF